MKRKCRSPSLKLSPVWRLKLQRNSQFVAIKFHGTLHVRNYDHCVINLLKHFFLPAAFSRHCRRREPQSHQTRLWLVALRTIVIVESKAVGSISYHSESPPMAPDSSVF